MPIDVQASIFTSGPNVRFIGDTIVSTLVVGNTGSGATATATGTTISVPVPSGATRTGWTREDRGTPGGSSAGSTSGTGAIAQTLDWDQGEFSIYTVVDVLPGLAGSSYTLTAVVTPPAGNLTPVGGLVGQVVATASQANCFDSSTGVQLRMTDDYPRHLAGELLVDNATLEVSNGVLRVRVSPHARGSSSANPVGLDPDGTGLNGNQGLPINALGIGLALSGTTLAWKGVSVPTTTVSLTVGAATAVRLTNSTTHYLLPFFGIAWLGSVSPDGSGNLRMLLRYSSPGVVNQAATPATNASSVFASKEIHGANVAYTSVRLRDWDLLGPIIAPGSYFEVSCYPHLEQGSTFTGTITATFIGLPCNP